MFKFFYILSLAQLLYTDSLLVFLSQLSYYMHLILFKFFYILSPVELLYTDSILIFLFWCSYYMLRGFLHRKLSSYPKTMTTTCCPITTYTVSFINLTLVSQIIPLKPIIIYSLICQLRKLLVGLHKEIINKIFNLGDPRGKVGLHPSSYP